LTEAKKPSSFQKFNTTLAPLAQLNSAFQLRWSDGLYEELSGQESSTNLSNTEDKDTAHRLDNYLI
jgi:hypothetical protein